MSLRSAFIAAGVPTSVASREGPLAEAAMLERAITTQRRARAFLAQVLHESARLVYFEEIASGAAYEGRRDLGNTQPGDGRRFKGRGPIQLTGRSNYREAGRALGLPLESQPTLAAQHKVGWRIAAWFWSSRGLNGLADRGAFIAITRRINGGTNGLADRQRLWAICKGHDCCPRKPGPAAWLTATELRRVRELDAIRAGAPPAHPRREAVLVSELTIARKRLWRFAQPRRKGGDGRGWHVRERIRRFASLRTRTR